MAVEFCGLPMARFGCDSSRCHYPVITKSSTINKRFTGNFDRTACSEQRSETNQYVHKRSARSDSDPWLGRTNKTEKRKGLARTLNKAELRGAARIEQMHEWHSMIPSESEESW